MGGLGLLPVLGGIIVLLLLVLWGMQRASKGERTFQAGRVTLVQGRKGHGKSIFLVHEMLRHLGRPQFCKKCTKKPELRKEFGAFKARFGDRWYHHGVVATNSSLAVSPELAPYIVKVSGFEDVASFNVDDDGNLTISERLPHCSLLALDEVQLWFPAKAGEVLPERQVVFLTQCRKVVVEMLAATQDVQNCATGLRRLTDEVGVCRKGLWARMSVTFWDPLQLNKPGQKSLWRYRYKVTKRLGNAYDTFELLAPAAKDDPRASKSAGAVPRAARSAGAFAPAPFVPVEFDTPAVEASPTIN